jgi:hypothetical protein
MAKQLVENLAEPFDPSRYTDDYRANLMKLIRAKMKGKKVTAAEPLPDEADSQVLDLMSRLQASLEEAAKARERRQEARGQIGATDFRHPEPPEKDGVDARSESEGSSGDTKGDAQAGGNASLREYRAKRDFTADEGARGCSRTRCAAVSRR